MRNLLIALMLGSMPALAESEKLSCFDVNGDAATEVQRLENLRVQIKDLVTGVVTYATGDIFAISQEVPLILTTEQLDSGGREMMAEGCRLNPTPNEGVVNVMLWSGKVNGLSPVADRCMTCFIASN